MRILFHDGLPDPDVLPFDCAERKGIGHPDTLANLIADAYSRAYSAHCLDAFGTIPNHWVDKVALVGAASNVSFGSFEVLKPVACHLIGKMTPRVGPTAIPLGEIFERVVRDVLGQALGDTEIWPHLTTTTYNTAGTATDHDSNFYTPCDPEDLRRVLSAETVCNDTVLCTGTSGPGRAGRLAIWLERRIAEMRLPQVGSDVKVMVVRDGEAFEVTAAVPVHPEAVRSWREYAELIRDVRAELAAELRDSHRATLRINTKDGPNRAYLAPFGTSLGKGDCGAVGRGNRGHGVIEPLRASSGDAPAGKNPVHHGGKIYADLANRAAQEIGSKTGRPAEVTIAARNGEPLHDPAFVLISLPEGDDRALAENIVRETLTGASDVAERFLAADEIRKFREATG
ncbi:methionine adenosyltransferase [Sphaerisporangium sp. NPDC051011]|uniref:methionine adenosyltransferase n=1 Tax=Sphaerisporangium sp. NPDC051011 TaxID=3155792 RepID=UPI00340DE313